MPVLEVCLHTPCVDVAGGVERAVVEPVARWPAETLHSEVDGLTIVVAAHEAVAADLLEP